MEIDYIEITLPNKKRSKIRIKALQPAFIAHGLSLDILEHKEYIKYPTKEEIEDIINNHLESTLKANYTFEPYRGLKLNSYYSYHSLDKSIYLIISNKYIEEFNDILKIKVSNVNELLGITDFLNLLYLTENPITIEKNNEKRFILEERKQHIIYIHKDKNTTTIRWKELR